MFLKKTRELDRVCPGDLIPELNDRDSLHCLRAVMHETMRVSSILPLGVPHYAAQDTRVNFANNN